MLSARVVVHGLAFDSAAGILIVIPFIGAELVEPVATATTPSRQDAG